MLYTPSTAPKPLITVNQIHDSCHTDLHRGYAMVNPGFAVPGLVARSVTKQQKTDGPELEPRLQRTLPCTIQELQEMAAYVPKFFLPGV